MKWIILTLLGVCGTVPPLAGQSFAPLRLDGNGIPALQNHIPVDLRLVPRAEALRWIAQRAGIGLTLSPDLASLGDRVSLQHERITPAAALLRVLQHSGLELRVSPSGQLVLVRRKYEMPRSAAIQAGIDTTATIPLRLAEIVVMPGRFGVAYQAVATPQSLSRDDLETAPQVGEDVFRMVSRIPGVATNDLSARFHVRGGSNRELLVQLDGLELIEPFHVKEIEGGALSIVDLEALGGVDLITGGLTAEYGNRLTGVFDMRTTDPSPDRPRTALGISMTNARVLNQGVWAHGRGEWLVSARRGYLDLVLDMVETPEDETLVPRYGDVLAKVQFRPDPNHTLSLHGLHAADRLSARDGALAAETRYRNTYGWLNWRARYGAAVSSHTVASLGDLGWSRTGAWGDRSQDVTVSDQRGLQFAGVRQDWGWDVSDYVLIKGGWERKALVANYRYSSQRFRSVLGEIQPGVGRDSVRIRTDPAGHESAAYLAARIRPWMPVTVEAGLRWDRQSYTGDRTRSPRLNAALAVGAASLVRAAWGVYFQAQGIHELQVQDGLQHFYPAERAEHRVIGAEHSTGGLSIRAEVYQRRLANIRPRWVNLDRSIDIFPEVEDDRVLLMPADGEARGLEVFVQHSGDRPLRWYASYTLARIHERIEARMVPREMDQRHAAHVGAAYVPNPRWRASAAWQFHSGWPITPRTFRNETLSSGERVLTSGFGSLHAERLPVYHRLDARFTRYWNAKRGRVSAFLDVYNLYNRENPRSYSYSFTTSPEGVMAHRGIQDFLPVLPSLGISWEF